MPISTLCFGIGLTHSILIIWRRDAPSESLYKQGLPARERRASSTVSDKYTADVPLEVHFQTRNEDFCRELGAEEGWDGWKDGIGAAMQCNLRSGQ